MRSMSLCLALSLSLALLAGCGKGQLTISSSSGSAQDPVAALEGGTPLPDGAMEIGFPWMGKQSVMCVGAAVERQIAFVDFSDEDRESIGSVSVAADGSAKGRFVVPAGELRTGAEKRDVKLQNHNWLEAEAHPDLVLECTSMTRVSPTVWKVEGSWTMKGVTKPVSFHANVRWVGEMRNVGTKVVRVKASFAIALRDFEIVNPSVGSPAVSEVWDVDVVLLGVVTAS